MAESTAGAVTISPLAGTSAPREMLVDLSRLEREYQDFVLPYPEARAIVDRATGSFA